MLDQRLNKRRVEWDREDSELRSVMGMATGAGDWGEMMRRLGMRDKPALEEMAGKPISARFDSAITTDDNRAHWAMADGLAADAAANPMIRYTLRNRARYEIANNCYAAGVGETIANDFCGTGPRLHIDDERLTDAEREDVETKFAAWAQAIDLAGKLRTMRKARRSDGETFACKITNPKLKNPVKLDLRVIEADQVRFVDISLLLSPSVDGIRYDDYGNPVSYHILRIHPGYWSYATGYVGMPWEYDVWDSSLVIHWFRRDRPGQHRGLPEILPALPLYATLRRYTQATLDAAETAADYAILLETQAGALFIAEDGSEPSAAIEEAQAFSTQQLQRRMMAALPAGYKATQMKPEQPTQEYANFKKEICSEIGRCESVPRNVVLTDSSDSNFGSGQLDHKIYFRTREIEREEANRLILENLLVDWIAEGVRAWEGNGDFGKVHLPAVLRTLGTSVQHSWYWDSNELGDPLKLAASKVSLMEVGLTTIPAEYEAKGKNWTRAFTAQARSLGCSVEELKIMVRNRIFAIRGQEPVDAPADTGKEAEVPGAKMAPLPTSAPTAGVKRPGQAALQKVTQ
jgi:hypothetical protein